MKILSRHARALQSGFSLLELMIGMTLGLFLLLGLMNVFLAQRQAYRVNENLAYMQDGARLAFELMAHDIREAGGNPCGTQRVANVVKKADTTSFSDATVWYDWNTGGLQGFDSNVAMPRVTIGTGSAQRVSDPDLTDTVDMDALIVMSASNDGAVIVQHTPSSSPPQFTVNTTAHGIQVDDLVMACDYNQATIIEVTGVSGAQIQYSGSGTIGHGCQDLGFPTVFSAADTCSALSYTFNANGFLGFLSRLSVNAWYVGHNSRGGTSLYRKHNGENAQEMIEGVASMRLQYLTRTGATLATSYVNASAVADWSNDAAALVVAVRITLGLESVDTVGTDGATIKRQVVHLVSLRHRENVQ